MAVYSNILQIIETGFTSRNTLFVLANKRPILNFKNSRRTLVKTHSTILGHNLTHFFVGLSL
jgi:hypothetical protein